MLLNERGFFDCNPRTLNMFGFASKDEFIALHPADVSPRYQADGQESWPAAQSHIQTAYQRGYERFEWIHRRTNGQDFPAEILLSAFDLGGQRVVQATVRDITERKRAEEALARERGLLRTLIDNLPDQVFIKDAAGHIVLYNEADAHAMGITSTEEAVGKTVYDLYPRELADRYHADDMAVVQSDEPLINREEPGLDKDGQIRWVLTTKVPLKDAQGNRLGLVGVARDVTARRQAEIKLQQSEERFRRFSDATHEGLVFHENGIILDANPAVVALFGYTTAADMIGHSILERIVPDCHALVIQQMQREEVLPYEIECIRPDGTIFPVETATRTYQYDGRTIRASSIRDITQRKQLEQAIRESFERRGHQVEVSRQVAQQIATATDVDDIFPLVVKLIKERFDYYHAQIFRYDPAQDAVVLVAGYGEAGQEMLSAGHSLPMGQGVVGMAAQSEKPILAADSTLAEDWQPNPHLPDTKGELAVPIKFQDEILGILDVQSDRVNALTQDDVLLLEGLAGQIAVAIASTRTLEEANTFRALAEAAGQGIAFASPDGRLAFANAAAAEMFGLPGADIIGRPVATLYPEVEYQQVQAAVAQAIEHGQWTGELLVRPVDRSGLVSTINDVFQVKDRKGNLRYLANIITDISERKVAEKRLAEAIQLAKIGYWVYDVPTDTFTFNDQFYALMRTTADREGGYTMSSGQYAQRFVHPVDAPLVGGEIGKSLQTTDPNYRGEISHRVYFGDGELGYVTVRFTIEKDAQGKTIRTSGANQDITDIRLAEQDLRASEAQLSQALQIAKLAYWNYDVPTDTFTFNDQFYALMRTTADREGGYTMSSGQYAQRFVHPEDAPLVGGEIGKSLQTTDPNYRGEVSHRVYFGDGELGYVTVRFTIEKDAQGKTIRTIGANQDITEIRRAEQDLRTSEAQLSQALQIAKLAYWEYDVEHDLFQFNDQFFALFHSTAAEHGGYQLSSAYYAQHFVHPDDLPIVGAEIEQALNSTDRHYTRSLEHRIQYADGGVGYISVSINIDRDEQGRILRYYGANQDISERKQAEIALLQSEAQLSEALKTASLAYWELDLAREKFIFNDQLYALLHTTAEAEGGYEMDVRAYVGRFIHPEDAAYVGMTIGQGLQNPDPTVSTQLEARVICADGEVRWLTTRVNNKVDSTGRTVKAVGTNQDITERKLAEAELQRSEQLMRNVIDSTPDWIFIKDQAHRYRLVNQGYATSLHLPIDAFIGKDDLELGFPEELVKGNPEKGIRGFWADDQQVMDSGETQVYANDPAMVDGAVHVFNTIKTPLRDATGKIWGVLAFARDISEREKLLQDMQRRNIQVEAVAEVGAATAELLDPQTLLDRVVRLTRRRFNLYHCHIFLLDEAAQNLRVQACGWRSPEDENRAATEHTIRLDAQQSLVARAARTRQPVVVNDVRSDPGWLTNPVLPDIQSEMALPMIVGDTVLGVFNVHSDELNHFTDEDARAMLTLATTTAVALQNARLFEETQRTAQELDQLNRRLTGEAWETYLQRKTPQSVVLAQSASPTAPAALRTLLEPLAAGQVIVDQAADKPAQTITAPIVLRGQTVGALRVQANQAEWNEDLQTVLTSIASHIAQAAENTRLLEESEIRLARERALAEATEKIRRRTEVDRILETAAAELAQYLRASAVTVRVGANDSAQSDQG